MTSLSLGRFSLKTLLFLAMMMFDVQEKVVLYKLAFDNFFLLYTIVILFKHKRFYEYALMQV